MKGIFSRQSAKPETHIDADAIRRLSELLNETGLSEIEIEQSGSRIRVARNVNGSLRPTEFAAPEPATAATREASPKEPVAGAVTSPMVGTVYVSPEPGAAPFVKVGQTVKEGDTLLIVEAMKTMNPITAPHAGVVKEICVNDSQPVEFGQILLVIG
ncbi:MAG: acetyl-CoA carboxylase biotin carboxyl carrier protein [Alphaproteobacteria bacterium]|nr:acetyl-CoA carboxylase biotin carboxyl carrier protein [Alphaproteobacteria bacterium]